MSVLSASMNNLYYPRVIVLDTESTGFAPSVYCKLIQLSAVKMEGEEIVDSFDRYVNPHLKVKTVNKETIHTGEPGIPKKIRELTGITDEVIKAREEAGISTESMDVIRDFLRFCQNEAGEFDSVLVMHNAPHDEMFLDDAVRGLNDPEGVIPVDFLFSSLPFIDTAAVAKELYPNRKAKGSYKLETLCRDFGILDENHHNAANDARITADLLLRERQDAGKGTPGKWETLISYRDNAKADSRSGALDVSAPIIPLRISPWVSKDGKMHRVYVRVVQDHSYGTVYYDFDRSKWGWKEGELKPDSFADLQATVMLTLDIQSWDFASVQRTAKPRYPGRQQEEREI